MIEQRGIEPAEIGVEFQIALAVEVGQAGCVPMRPGLTRPPARRTAAAVPWSVPGWRFLVHAARTRKDNHQHAVELAARRQVVDERRHRRR